MRRILFIVLSLVSISVRAEFKTVQQAMSEAQNFISCRQQQSQAKGIRKTKDLVLVTEPQARAKGAKAEDDMPAYYIFNYADSTGFVIVSAESETLSILAYSDTDYFHVEDIDKGADIFLNQYADDVEKVRAKGLSITEKAFVTTKNATTSTNGEVLLQTACFNQYDGYWNEKYSPYIEGKKSTPAGCTITAMAIIMAYNKWPAQGKGSNNYTSKTLGLKLGMDFSTINFDWDNMPTTPCQNGSWTETQKEMVPQLLLACGIASDTDYNIGGSSASIINAKFALVDNFSYSIDYNDICKDALSASDFDVAKSSIDDNHPVMVIGYGKRGFHAFVLDGYNNTYYHYNMGWGGSNNAWFANGSISSDNYSIREIIGGIKPQSNIVLETENKGGITYSLDDTGVLKISGKGATSSQLLKNSQYASRVAKCIIDEGITKLDEWTLYPNLYLVREINFPSSLISIPIGNLLSSYIKNIKVDAENQVYCSLNDNSLYDKSKTTLIRGVGHFSFEDIPQTTTTIGTYAFYNSHFPLINIPHHIKTINDFAFSYCYETKNIVIGKHIVSIGKNAFKDCTGISSYTCYALSVPTIDTTTFINHPSNAILYVPEPSIDLYKRANYWNSFTTILPIEGYDIDDIKAIKDTEHQHTARKVLENGKLLIILNDKKYAIDGCQQKF